MGEKLKAHEILLNALHGENNETMQKSTDGEPERVEEVRVDDKVVADNNKKRKKKAGHGEKDNNERQVSKNGMVLKGGIFKFLFDS